MATLRRRFDSRPAWLVLGLWAVVLLGLLAAQGCTTSSQDTGHAQESGQSELPPAPRVGRLAPDFTLTNLEGNSLTLSDLRGKAVFINFWATWCPPCRAEMPEIEAVYQQYKNKNVVVIGVDLYEDESLVRQYVERGGFSWTFVIDSNGEVTKNYAITAIPTSFFLDKEGVIQAVNIGAMTEKAMASQLAKALE
ncbi:MAG: redoxin family protein [Chloroflexi bacterium]|nr:redoxin family protein [Chloroflexota bacterium]